MYGSLKKPIKILLNKLITWEIISYSSNSIARTLTATNVNYWLSLLVSSSKVEQGRCRMLQNCLLKRLLLLILILISTTKGLPSSDVDQISNVQSTIDNPPDLTVNSPTNQAHSSNVQSDTQSMAPVTTSTDKDNSGASSLPVYTVSIPSELETSISSSNDRASSASTLHSAIQSTEDSPNFDSKASGGTPSASSTDSTRSTSVDASSFEKEHSSSSQNVNAVSATSSPSQTQGISETSDFTTSGASPTSASDFKSDTEPASSSQTIHSASLSTPALQPSPSETSSPNPTIEPTELPKTFSFVYWDTGLSDADSTSQYQSSTDENASTRLESRSSTSKAEESPSQDGTSAAFFHYDTPTPSSNALTSPMVIVSSTAPLESTTTEPTDTSDSTSGDSFTEQHSTSGINQGSSVSSLITTSENSPSTIPSDTFEVSSPTASLSTPSTSPVTSYSIETSSSSHELSSSDQSVSTLPPTTDSTTDGSLTSTSSTSATDLTTTSDLTSSSTSDTDFTTASDPTSAYTAATDLTTSSSLSATGINSQDSTDEPLTFVIVTTFPVEPSTQGSQDSKAIPTAGFLTIAPASSDGNLQSPTTTSSAYSELTISTSPASSGEESQNPSGTSFAFSGLTTSSPLTTSGEESQNSLSTNDVSSTDTSPPPSGEDSGVSSSTDTTTSTYSDSSEDDRFDSIVTFSNPDFTPSNSPSTSGGDSQGPTEEPSAVKSETSSLGQASTDGSQASTAIMSFTTSSSMESLEPSSQYPTATSTNADFTMSSPLPSSSDESQDSIATSSIPDATMSSYSGASESDQQDLTETSFTTELTMISPLSPSGGDSEYSSTTNVETNSFDSTSGQSNPYLSPEATSPTGFTTGDKTVPITTISESSKESAIDQITFDLPGTSSPVTGEFSSDAEPLSTLSEGQASSPYSITEVTSDPMVPTSTESWSQGIENGLTTTVSFPEQSISSGSSSETDIQSAYSQSSQELTYISLTGEGSTSPTSNYGDSSWTTTETTIGSTIPSATPTPGYGSSSQDSLGSSSSYSQGPGASVTYISTASPVIQSSNDMSSTDSRTGFLTSSLQYSEANESDGSARSTGEPWSVTSARSGNQASTDSLQISNIVTKSGASTSYDNQQSAIPTDPVSNPKDTTTSSLTSPTQTSQGDDGDAVSSISNTGRESDGSRNPVPPSTTHSFGRSTGAVGVSVTTSVSNIVTATTGMGKTWWFSSSIEVQSNPSRSGTTSFNPSVTATLPHVIAPQTTVVPAPGSRKITVGFDRGLNYEFLVSHPQSPAQIFAFLPSVLTYPFRSEQPESLDGTQNMNNNVVSKFEQNGTTTISPATDPHSELATHSKYSKSQHLFNVTDVQVIQIMPMTLEGRDYLLSVAVVYFPKGYVSDLQGYVLDSQSNLYRNPNPSFDALAQLIDPTIPLVGLIDDTSGGSSSNSSEGPVQSQSESGSSNSSLNSENSGSLESTKSSPFSFAITKRLLIYLTCFVFVVFLWIMASLLLYKHFQKGRNRSANLPLIMEDNEKREYLSANVTSLHSAASSAPSNSTSVAQGNNKEAASNHSFPEDLVVTGENTVYSVSHGLEYYVAEDGSFYYAGALDSTTDGEVASKHSSADLEDIDEFLYSGDHEASSVGVNEASYDIGSLEIDEEGNFIVSDPSQDVEPPTIETNNSETVESYNNRNLYKLVDPDYSYEGSNALNSESIQPMNTWGISDSSRPAHNLSQGSLSRSAYAFYSTDSSRNIAQYLPGGDSIDEYLYNGQFDDDGADNPFEVQIDEIDDDVVDVNVRDLDELDEEMYKRLSKIMNQQNNESGNLHISNVIAAKAHSSDTKTGSSRRSDFQSQH